MDWLTFVATLAGALAWPVATVLILLALRRPLLELLPQVRRLRISEFEAEFDKGMSQVQERVADALPTQMAEVPAPESAEVRLSTLATVAPAAAVMETWKQLERAARQLLSTYGYSIDGPVATPYSLIEGALGRVDLIEPKQLKLFRELRQLRNKVSHAQGYAPTPEQAVEYVHAAMALTRFLQGQRTVPRAAA